MHWLSAVGLRKQNFCGKYSSRHDLCSIPANSYIPAICERYNLYRIISTPTFVSNCKVFFSGRRVKNAVDGALHWLSHSTVLCSFSQYLVHVWVERKQKIIAECISVTRECRSERTDTIIACIECMRIAVPFEWLSHTYVHCRSDVLGFQQRTKKNLR